LYKTKACAHCRVSISYSFPTGFSNSDQTESQSVIFTDDPLKRFEDYRPEDFASQDDNLGIKYEKLEIFEDTVLLLRYNCPDPNCDVACLGWPDLHRHVKAAHHKFMW
jgi:hypothetical protein